MWIYCVQYIKLRETLHCDSLSANQVLKQVAFIITIVYIDAIVALPSSIVMIMME